MPEPSPRPTLEVLTELRRALVNSLECVSQDLGLKNYPLLIKDFREQAGLVRDLVSSLQDACIQSSQVPDPESPRTRQDRLGKEKNRESW